MRTDIEIRTAGIQTLLTALGDIEAERFLVLINREKFDYTQWCSQQWNNVQSLIWRRRLERCDLQKPKQTKLIAWGFIRDQNRTL